MLWVSFLSGPQFLVNLTPRPSPQVLAPRLPRHVDADVAHDLDAVDDLEVGVAGRDHVPSLKVGGAVRPDLGLSLEFAQYDALVLRKGGGGGSGAALLFAGVRGDD